jgi:Peptidase S24-like
VPWGRTARNQPGPGRRTGLGRVVVTGRSMLPTLQPGDQLLVHWGRMPTVGRLVIVRLADGLLGVKRAVRHDDDGWWVERDNRAEGVDSWQVGAFRDADVLATVVCRYWPPRRRPRGSAAGRP